MRIAETAAKAWDQSQAGGGSTAVGVVAAIALTERADPSGPDPVKMLTEAPDEAIARVLTGIWAEFWMDCPELARLTGPLAGWMNNKNPARAEIRSIANVARAAVQAGLLDLASSGSLRDTDLLGLMYHQMRARGGASANWAQGEFATPPAVCKLMADLALSGPGRLKPGSPLAAGPSGTGELLRAYAGHIREQDMDPAGFWWITHGITPAAVAVTAVNCHLWDLGPHVVIGIADSIAEPGWPKRAWAEQQAAINLRDTMVLAEAMRTSAGSTTAASKRASRDFPGQPAKGVPSRTSGSRRPSAPPSRPIPRRTPCAGL